MQALYQAIHTAFHRPSTRLYQRVEVVIWIFILASIALLAADIAFEFSAAAEGVLARVDQAILVFFALELILRVGSYTPPALGFYRLTPSQQLKVHITDRLRFLFRPMIMVDLVTVLGSVPVLRGLRAVRLLRLLRTERLFRYSNPFIGIARAFEENALLYAFGLSVFGTLVVVGGLSFFLSEHTINEDIRTIPDAMWWSIVTITTVGYGDLTPETTVGRMVAAVLMVSGMVTLALFAGIVGSSLMNTVLSMREETFRMSNTIDHIVICGYQPGARMLLDTLNEELDLDQHTVVVFAPYQRPPDVPPEFRWIMGDPTKESELEKVRITNAAAAILVGARGELPQQADATTILTAFTLRRYMRKQELDPPREAPLYIVAEVLDAENVEHARTAGADEVIETTRMGFSLLAHAVEVHGTATILGELADVSGNSLFVGRVPDDLEEPHTFGSVSRQLKARHGMLVLGMRKPGEDDDLLNPDDDTPVGQGDGVIYLARRTRLPPM